MVIPMSLNPNSKPRQRRENIGTVKLCVSLESKHVEWLRKESAHLGCSLSSRIDSAVECYMDTLGVVDPEEQAAIAAAAKPVEDVQL
jgi:hypothetical protein